jgi:tRNA (guanine-N7-)-methyltransferase
MAGVVTAMSISDKEKARRSTFFGRRKGHALRPRQAHLFDSLLPRLALDLTLRAPADLAALFPNPVDEVSLEIGFGGGEHMIAQAEQQPRTGFIGVEPFVNGMAKALAAIELKKLANIRLHFDDATPLLQWLPAASLACVDLIYPDPWPKRRHWKRRFVQDESISAIARILRPGGKFHFATDVPDYAAWTLKHVTQSPDFTWTAERADDWCRPWPGFSGTRYEAKAKREGRAPCYLTFRRMHGGQRSDA